MTTSRGGSSTRCAVRILCTGARSPTGRGFWSVTRYDDIWAVDKDTEAFSSEEFVNLEDVDPEFMDLRRSMLETDGPRHQAMRALIAREFSPRNLMKNYEGFLRELTKQTVDEAFEHEEFDFVEKISGDFPIQVLARLLDVPKEDTGQLIAWGDEMVGNTDPDYTKFPFDSPESEKYKHLPFRSPTTQEVFDYGRALRDGRKGGDGTDLVSILANKLPMDGGPAHRHRLRQLLPAPRHRRQRDHASGHQQHHARPDASSATSCGRCRRTPRSSRRASRSCCGGPARSTTSVVRRPATSSSAARRSGGRQGRHVVRLGQPRRLRLRGPVRAST